MNRAEFLCATLAFAGLVLVLSNAPWFGRVTIEQRLRPYVGRATRRAECGSGVLSINSVRDVIAPLAQFVGTRLARACGVQEDLALRLDRVHSAVTPAQFRVRQATYGFGALVLVAAAVAALGVPALASLFFVLAAPAIAFLVAEQRLMSESVAWQRRTFLELPVISEQLGMLLGAGYSLVGALNRVAERSNGACARDIAIVCDRIRQGLNENDALHEWATRVDVPAVHRLVTVLALNRQAADLSRLISEEARTVRRDAQRDLIEQIERRTQMVWIPVTVAALVPGVIFMAVPFVRALSLFSGS